MYNVFNIYCVSLYFSEEEDGVDDFIEVVDVIYSNILGIGFIEKIV